MTTVIMVIFSNNWDGTHYYINYSSALAETELCVKLRQAE